MGDDVRRRDVRPRVERLDGRCLPAGFSPAQVAAVYGLADLQLPTTNGSTVPGDGTGATIAIVSAYHHPNLLSDLRVFNEMYGLPPADVTVVNLGGDATNDVWAAESAMDVQWAHALAPGASIVLVEAISDESEHILAAVDVARNIPGVVVVSMSFGFTETPGQHVYDGLFTTPPGRSGVTFIAASGDHGPIGGAMYPSSSPNVLGVGGTTLSLDASGALASESVWSKSGSGPGRYTTQPAYQRSFQQTGFRTTPDVSFLGDPSTGVGVYVTPPSGTEGSWRTLAGTSLGAPAWASLIAIVSQARALHGLPSLDGPTETLPLLYSLAGVGFRSVANPGSATAAGLGAPIGDALVSALTHATARTPVTIDPPPTRTQPTPRARPLPIVQTRQPMIRREPMIRRRELPTPVSRPTPVRQPRIALQTLRLRRGLVEV